MNVLIEIEEKRIIDLISCGLQGGINYWAKIKLLGGQGWYDINNEDWRIEIKDLEDDQKAYILDKTKIEKGLEKMYKKASWHFKNFIAENEDSQTGDVFLQLCIFEEIIYG